MLSEKHGDTGVSNTTGHTDAVELWRKWIIERMLERAQQGQDPGSVDDVIEAAKQAREFFEEQLLKLRGAHNA